MLHESERRLLNARRSYNNTNIAGGGYWTWQDHDGSSIPLNLWRAYRLFCPSTSQSPMTSALYVCYWEIIA
jgi:hypothetical protein